ncbi:hypothetical protein HPB49_012265 [Dermacentor silvarum]|uniref:Uncharacterized protein n=1 Tax=Dermacentor silvarum TaxID=543639 RepID=A0ACB8DPC0_DERSI|nr:hypothetical protein HPB49_012265 [Dermacentor silvarum]
MADNEDRKSGGTFDQKEKNAEDNAGATEDAPPRSTREALGKSKSLPALERPSARNNTRISQSESSFIASLKQRSVVPEERTVRRFGEIKLVRTLSQLVGSEHSFVEEEGAEGQEAGEAPGETQAGDTLSYMDFPSTIGTDTKLDAELRHPVRSAETVGEGKTEDALVVTRLQGEATVAPTTMESSVGEPQIAKVLSDLEREKKPVLTSADEVTVYTSFSDSSAPKREADHKLPFPSEGAEEEMAKLTAPGTSRPDVIKSAEEAHRPVPFKTPEETTAGSEVEDTLVERAGLDKQVEELPSKTMTRVETVEPRGDWEGPAGEKTEEETALIKHPPKRRVSTQVSESQASEWRIVERPVPFGSEDQQIRTMDNQVLRATEDHPTMVSPTIAEILMEVELSVEYEMEGLPAVKEPHAMQKSESRELAEPFPTSVVDTAEGPALERQIPEIEAAVTEATTAEVAKREEPLPPTVPEPCEALRAAPGVLQVETVNTKDGALGETALQEIDADKQLSCVKSTLAVQPYPDEAPPIASYDETTPYIEPLAPQTLLTEAQELTQKLSEGKLMLHEAGVEEVSKVEAIPQSDTTLQVRRRRRRSSVRPLTEWIVPGYRRVSSDREAGEAAKEEPSYIDTTPILEFHTQEAPPIPSYEETTPYIDFSLATDDAELKRKYSEGKVGRHEAGAEEVVSKVEPSPPSFTTLKMRRRSSIMPPTAAVVPGYRRKSSTSRTVEAAAKEPSYIETTPSLESYPQEAPPKPSYEETTPYLEPFPPEALVTDTALPVRRRSSVRPLTEWIVPGYRRVSSDREAGEAAKEEPSYIDTTPILEFYTQEAPPIPSYEETTPYIDFSLATDDAELKRKYSEGKVVPHEAGPEKVVSKVQPSPPSFTTLKMRRRSSIMPPTAAVVPGYRRKSSTSRTVEAAAKEPSYIETTPSLESYPQEAPPKPSYEETTPYLEPFPPEALATDTALQVRRRSSVRPLTEWIVPGYRRVSSDREAGEAAKEEPSYIDTTPILEFYTQEAPPIPSYEETTPYIDFSLATDDAELKRKYSEGKVVPHEAGPEKVVSKVQPSPPSFTTLKMRRRSSIMPPTAAVVPGYRRKSSTSRTVEAAAKEPSYIETTPSLESYPQEAPPKPSYEETTPYLEPFPPEALATDTALQVRRRSSVRPLTEWIVPGYRRVSSDREAGEVTKEEPSYIDTTPILEFYTQEAPPIPSYEETTPYIDFSLATDDAELKRKYSEGKVVPHEAGAEKVVSKVEPSPPSFTTLKMRRRSSIMPPTAAVVPGYRRKSSTSRTVEAAAKEPSYIETTPSLEAYPQEAPPKPSYEETTPYLEPFPHEALATDTALQVRRRSSVRPLTEWIVPGYRRVSSDREAGEAAKEDPSYIDTTPILEFYTQEAPPIPSYEETTPYIDFSLATDDAELKRKYSEGKVVPHEAGAEKVVSKVEPSPPSFTTLKMRRRSSIMPPTAAVVPGYRRKSSTSRTAEAAAKEPSYIETTPSLESYPQEAPPKPSYEETTPYLEPFPPEALATDTSLQVRRRSSVRPLTEWIVPGYRRVSSDREAGEAAKEEPSYIDTTPILEFYTQEAPPIPSYEETTPYIDFSLATDDAELKRKHSERKVVRHEAGAEKVVSKVEPSPPSFTTLKMRRRSSIMPPTAAVVPGYRRKSSARGTVEAAAKEPSYIETTPSLESYPQEAPPIPSYEETTPYLEPFPPEALATDTALQVRRRSSVRPLTEWIVPGYRRVSLDREAGEAAKEEPSYISTTPILEFYTQEAPPIPSYEETTPYIDFKAPSIPSYVDTTPYTDGYPPQEIPTDAVKLQPKPFASMPELREAMPVEEPSKHEAMISAPLSRELQHPSSGTPPSTALVSLYQYKSRVEEIIEGPVAVKAEGAITELIAPQVPTTVDAGAVIDSYVGTTPALESFRQEAPPIPSYEETTPHIESFAPEAIAADDLGLKRKQSERKVIHHEAGAEEKVSKVVALPPSAAAFKMRRRSSVMPPTDSVVPGYHTKSLAREAAEAAAKEPSYTETTPALESHPQKAPPKSSYAETSYIESLPSASSVVEAKALGLPVSVEEGPALDLRKVSSVVQEWALMEIRPPTGTEITEKKETRLAVVDREEVEGRVVPAFQAGESAEGSLVAFPTSAQEKPSTGGIFSHVSMPSSRKRSRQVSDVTGLKHAQRATQQGGEEITVTVPDYEADHEELPSSTGTQSSQEEEELGKGVRKEKVALTLYDEKAPTVVLEAKKHAERLAPEEARIKSVVLKPEVKESQPFVPMPEEASSLVELAQPLVLRPESVMTPAEQPLSAGELLPSTHQVVSGEKAVAEWKPAAVISVTPEPAELSESVARPVAEETSRIPGEVVEVGELEKERPKFAPVPKPPDSVSELPEQGVYATVISPKRDEPLRVFAGIHAITEPKKVPPAGAIERTHDISAPWSTRSSVAAAEEASRGRAAWEKELTRAAGADRRIERLHEKKTAKYSVIIKDGQPVRSISSSSEFTEPVKEDFTDNLAYQYVASEEQVLERIVTLGDTAPTAVTPHPPSDNQPPGAGTKGDASGPHTLPPRPDRSEPKQREEPHSEGPTSEPEFERKEAAPFTNVPDEMVAASVQAVVQEDKQGSSYEIGIPIDEQTEFPTMREDLEKEDQQPEETTADAGFEEFSAAGHAEKVPKAGQSTVESSTALESSEQPLALEYLPAQVDTHVSTTQTPSGMPLLAQLVKMQDETTFEPEKDVPTIQAFEKDYMIPTASQRSDQEEARILTAAPEKIAVETTKLQKLESGPELPQIEHIFSRAAVVEEKPNTDTELTALVVLPQQKVKDEIRHEEAAGQPDITTATVPENDVLRYALIEQNYVEPTCPPQPVIAVEDEIPALEAISERAQPQLVQVPAHAEALAEAALYVHPALTEPQERAAFGEITTIAEVRQSGLEPTKDTPQVDDHAPVQATEGERRELRPTIAESEEFKIYQPAELVLSEVVEKPSQALVPRTAQKQMSEAPSIGAADVEATKQQTAAILFIEAPAGVTASRSEKEAPVKQVSPVAAEEQMSSGYYRRTRTPNRICARRPRYSGRRPNGHSKRALEEHWQALLKLRKKSLLKTNARTSSPSGAVLLTNVPQKEEDEEVSEEPKAATMTPTIPEARPLLEPDTGTHGVPAEKQATEGASLSYAQSETAALEETRHKDRESIGERLAIQHHTPEADTKEVKLATASVAAVKEEIAIHQVAQKTAQPLAQVTMPDALVVAMDKKSGSVISVTEEQVTEIPDALSDMTPATTGTVQWVTDDAKFKKLQHPTTDKAPEHEFTPLTEQQITEMLQIWTEDQLLLKPSHATAVTESRSMSPTERAQRQQGLQALEVPGIEVRSAGDFSSEGAAVLVDVEDVDEEHEYHEEVREKRSTSIASMLRESPATIMAQLNVASSKPESPAEREGEAVLEPRFHTPNSEEELDKAMIAGAITDLSTLPEEVTKSLTDITEATITGPLPALRQSSAPDLQGFQEREPETAALKAHDQIAEVSTADAVAEKPLPATLAERPSSGQALEPPSEDATLSSAPSAYIDTTPYMAACPVEPAPIVARPEVAGLLQENIVVKAGPRVEPPMSVSTAAGEGPAEKELAPAVGPTGTAEAEKEPETAVEPALIVERPKVAGLLQEYIFAKVPPKVMAPVHITTATAEGERKQETAAPKMSDEITSVITQEPQQATIPEKPPAIEHLGEENLKPPSEGVIAPAAPSLYVKTTVAYPLEQARIVARPEMQSPAPSDVLPETHEEMPLPQVLPKSPADQAAAATFAPTEPEEILATKANMVCARDVLDEEQLRKVVEESMSLLKKPVEAVPTFSQVIATTYEIVPMADETRVQTAEEAVPEILPVSLPGISVVQAHTEMSRAGDTQLAIPEIEQAPAVTTEMQELRLTPVSARAEEPIEKLSQGIPAMPAVEPHSGLASQLSQVEPTSLAVAGAKGSLAVAKLAAPHTQPSAAKPELTEQPQKSLAKEEQLPFLPSPEPTTTAASLDIAEAALQSAIKVVEEKVREAAAAAERDAKKVEEEKEAASVTAVSAPPIEVVESVSAIPGIEPTQPVGQPLSGLIDDMRAEAPGVSESELAIAEALRASREEARMREEQRRALVQGIVAEAVRPQLEQHEAEVVSLESLARPLISEREMDQAQISGTVLPPSETKTYAEFQKSLKASSATTVPRTAAVALRRSTPDHAVAVPDAEPSKGHADIGESVTVIEPALQRQLGEKDKEEIRELAVAAVMVAAASAVVNAQQQREISALQEPSETGSMVSAPSEIPIASTVSREIRQKITGELEMLPSASRTALVAVLAAQPPRETDVPNAIAGPPSTTSTSGSTEDAGRLRRDSSRDRSEDFRVPETLVPALDDEIHVPRPTSFNVPVINIQYNFHFPQPGSPGAPGRQSPPSPEQSMAAQVLQGALAQQGMAGHIPGRHILSPEQAALREMTERLNRVALHGSEPYTGRQSPGRGTMFRPLPRKPVPPVPPLLPPGDDMTAQERKRVCGFRFIVCLLAFLMIVFILLYCLGLIGNKRYFMYYG